jgi:NTP pyrophosphatase (non-canonical NTP hydrolase)
MFELIRQWARHKKILQHGDTKTQYIKLQEESGELAEAILTNNKEEIKDAIGDMVVVLTSLSYFSGFTIEEAIESAYNEIKNREGKIINNTFVKN